MTIQISHHKSARGIAFYNKLSCTNVNFVLFKVVSNIFTLLLLDPDFKLMLKEQDISSDIEQQPTFSNCK